MKSLIYFIFKVYVKTGLFFYNKKIIVAGSNNIPRKGAVMFLANHPNGLIDPLLIATSIKRRTHFLVRAAVFNKPIIAKFFNLLGMMPIYRIRDGVKQLSKNDEIFNKCFTILKNKNALLIFPEGSHSRKRAVRPLSKGFTRIVFGTLEKYPDTEIHLIPVGITYQNSSKYPGKVAIYFGKPIHANEYYTNNNLNKSVTILKEKVSTQLKKLCVHIPEEKYHETLELLNKNNVDFTNVIQTNKLIESKKFINLNNNTKSNFIKPLKFLIITNSILPYLLWKKISKTVSEIEFIDTFRFGLNVITFLLTYIIQGYILTFYSNATIGVLYTIASFLLVLLYTKLSVTPAE